jgi:hypothetical protein
LTGQPAPSIPANAVELVTKFDSERRKTESQFWLNRRLVGRATWYPNGGPCLAVGLRGNAVHGYQVEYHHGDVSGVSYAEPFVGGRVHGLAKQFDVDGHLVLASPFVHGTGVDYWCDENGRLAEEHPIVDGRISGCERWWNPDGKTVFAETYYRNGLRHGLSREWSARKMRVGFPKFFLKGKEVSRSQYLRARKRDASLPAHLQAEDSPQRHVPQRFTKLRQRAALLRRSDPPSPVRKFRRPISQEPVVLGKVVAERRYQVGSEFILLQIGTPHRATWRTDFYCPVRIVGRETKLLRAFGIDSVQALVLAFDLARAHLGAMTPPVYWFAGERLGDVGIDKRLTTGWGLDFDKKAEELVERMVIDRNREFERRRGERRLSK